MSNYDPKSKIEKCIASLMKNILMHYHYRMIAYQILKELLLKLKKVRKYKFIVEFSEININ